MITIYHGRTDIIRRSIQIAGGSPTGVHKQHYLIQTAFIFISTFVMADVQAVLSALQVFNGAPDKASLEGANIWLQDFQHSVNHLSPWTNRDQPV
jgi:hypothetical protein